MKAKVTYRGNFLQVGTLKFILLFVCLTVFEKNEAQEYEAIKWRPDYKLTWADFKGQTPSNDRAAATTASGISYQFSTSGTRTEMKLDFKVSTFFYPNKSWYQPSLCDSLILSHEQLHFDISELFARKMRKRLNAGSFTQKVKAEVRSIYKEILEELEEYQDLYDEETNFSRNIEQQLIWNKKIKKALEN